MSSDVSPSPETFTYEIAESESISEAVVTAVTAVTGDDTGPGPARPADDAAAVPTLEPLYAVVDPDALDALFRPVGSSARTDGRIQFTYAGCEVTVESDGRVHVRETNDRRL